MSTWLLNAARWGWHSAPTLGAAVIGLAAGGVLVAWETAMPTPLLDLRQFARRDFLANTLASAAAWFAIFVVDVYTSMYLQRVLGLLWRPPAWATGGNARALERFVWAALDCSGGFALDLAAPAVPVMTGRLTAEVLRAPQASEPCAVLGWHSGSEGRKRLARSAVVSRQGELLAYAAAVWLEVRGDSG